MKWLKRILITLAVLIVLFVLVGFLLPRNYHVERSITVNANKAAVYPFIVNLKTWQEWIPWNVKRDPSLKQEFAAVVEGAGASYSWSGKDSGRGTIKLASVDPEKGIMYDLDFEHGQQVSHGEIRFESVSDATKVTWTNDGDMGYNPIARYFGILMDRFMGPDFESGLATLKAKVESANSPR